MSALEAARTWARMVKLPHTAFALPFALSGAVLAAAESGITPRQIFWIVVAMFGARNAAMGFNRLVDLEYDARNPRTSDRELPARRLSPGIVWGVTAGLAALAVLASFQLSPLCGWLSPLALLIVFGYSYTKRMTWASHLFLGLSLALAPVGGWLAVSGRFAVVAWLLGLAVLLWVAGFDVIYACQDLAFDRMAGLHSIPARFGAARALAAARWLHSGALAALLGVGALANLHPVYWVGCLAIAALLAWEHRLVRAEDLAPSGPSQAGEAAATPDGGAASETSRRLGVAFFNLNATVSAVYLATVLAAVLL